MAKKALLVGCNYPVGNKPLKGCVNDVFRMKTCLKQYYGFKEEDITILIDTDPSYIQPTANNIEQELFDLVDSAERGDTLFFHFSGHGSRQDDMSGIVGTDGRRILAYTLRFSVEKVPEGCTLTIVADCCYSGGLIEGAKEQIGDSTLPKQQTSRAEIDGDFPSQDYDYVAERYCDPDDGDLSDVDVGVDRDRADDRDPVLELLTITDELTAESSEGHLLIDQVDRGILLSSCQSYEKAREVGNRPYPKMPIGPGNPVVVHGCFSRAITTAIVKNKGLVTNWELVCKVREYYIKRGYRTQTPGLYCADHHAHAPFLGAEISKPESSQELKEGILVHEEKEDEEKKEEEDHVEEGVKKKKKKKKKKKNKNKKNKNKKNKK